MWYILIKSGLSICRYTEAIQVESQMSFFQTRKIQPCLIEILQKSASVSYVSEWHPFAMFFAHLPWFRVYLFHLLPFYLFLRITTVKVSASQKYVYPVCRICIPKNTISMEETFVESTKYAESCLYLSGREISMWYCKYMIYTVDEQYPWLANLYEVTLLYMYQNQATWLSYMKRYVH